MKSIDFNIVNKTLLNYRITFNQDMISSTMTAEQVTNYDIVVSKLAGNLPSIPVLVNDMMKVASDPGAATFALCDIIQKDQSVYAKILKIANSVEFRKGGTDRITQINDAVLRIGSENVRRTLLSTSVLDSFRSD